MRLRKYEAKIDSGDDGDGDSDSDSDGDGDGGSGGISASGDIFSFCRQLKSNLLKAVVFPPWRISRHPSGEMFALRRRWKFLRYWRGRRRRFFARAKSSSGEQVEMSGNDQTVRWENWSLRDGRLDVLLTT